VAFIKQNTKQIKTVFIFLETAIVVICIVGGYYYYNSAINNSIAETKKDLAEQSIHKSEHIENYLIGKKFEGEALFNNDELASNLIELIENKNVKANYFLTNYYNKLFRNFYFDNAIILNLKKEVLFEAKPGSVKGAYDYAVKSELTDTTTTTTICILDYDFNKYTVTTRNTVINRAGNIIGWVVLFSHGKRLNTLFEKTNKLESENINMFLTKLNSDKIFLSDKPNVNKNEILAVIDKIQGTNMDSLTNPVIAFESLKHQTFLIATKRVKGTNLVFTIMENLDLHLQSFDSTRVFVLVFVSVISGFFGLLFIIVYKKYYGLSPKRLKEIMEKSKLKNIFEITENSFLNLQILINNKGEILEYNDLSIKKFGYSIEEFDVINFIELLKVDYKKETVNKLNELPVLGRVVFESECVTKSGNLFPVEMSLNLFRILENDYIHCFIQDLTEKKETINELKSSQRVYTTLLKNLPGIAYRCKNDEHYTMEFLSEGCRDLTGYNVDELTNNKKIGYSDLICDEYKQKVINNTNAGVHNKTHFSYEYEIETKLNGRK